MAGITLRLDKKDLSGKLLWGLRNRLKGAHAKAGALEEGKGQETDPATGITMAQLAAVHEFGAKIQHPGGTPYMLEADGSAVFLPKGDPRAVGVTKPHEIVIPERSFMRAAFAANRNKYVQHLEKGLAAILAGKVQPRKVFQMLGLEMARDIQSFITQGKVQPPDKPATIAAKQQKGHGKGSPKTLIDSGQLASAITGIGVVPDDGQGGT